MLPKGSRKLSTHVFKGERSLSNNFKAGKGLRYFTDEENEAQKGSK